MPATAPDATEQSPRRRSWGRRILLASITLLLLAGIALVALYPRLEIWTRNTLEQRISAAVGGRAEIGSLELRLFRLEVRFSDVQIRTGSRPGPTHIAVRSGRARLALSGLFGLPAGRIHLAELRLVGPVFELAALPVGSKPTTDPRPFDLRIHRLEVEQGSLQIEDRQQRLDLQAREVWLGGNWDARRQSMVGRAEFSMDFRQPPLVHPVALQVAGGYRWSRHDVELVELSAVGEGIQIRLDGQLSLLEGQGFVARGEVDADASRIAGVLEPGLPEISGRVSGPFSVEVGPDPLRILGAFRANRARFGPILADQVEATALITPGRLELLDLQARMFDGQVGGKLQVRWPEPTEFDADLTGRDLDSLALLRWLKLPLPLQARIDAGILLRGDADDLTTWSGVSSFETTSPNPGGSGLPTAGRGQMRLESGRLELTAPEVLIAGSRLAVKIDAGLGTVQRDAVVELEGSTEDAAWTQDGTMAILQSLKVEVPGFVSETLQGTGSLRSRIEVGDAGRLELALDLTDGAWGRQEFDRASVDLKFASGRVDLRDMKLRRGDERLAGTASLQLEPLSLINADLEFGSLDVAWLAELADLGPAPEGRVTGALQVQREAGVPSGRGSLSFSGGNWFGESIEQAAGSIHVHGQGVRFTDLQLRGPAFRAEGTGAWNFLDHSVELKLHQGQLQLGQLQTLIRGDLPLEAEIQLQGGIRFEPGRVVAELPLSSDRLEVSGRSLGAVQGLLELDSHGALLRLASSAGDGWAVAASVGWRESLPFDAVVRLDRTPLELTDGPDGLWGMLTGEAKIQGMVEHPESLRLDGTLEQIELHAGVKRVEARDVPLRVEAGALTLGPTRFQGGESDFAMRTQYEWATDRIVAEARGLVGLGLLAAPFPEIRASGQATMELSASGTRTAPQLEGRITAENGRLRWLGFPQALDRLNFALDLQGQEVRMSGLRARFGNGEIQGQGTAQLHGFVPREFQASIEGANVRVAYPEGFRGVYEGTLSLAGTTEASTITGHVEMLRGLYEKEFELLQLVGGGTREYAVEDALWLPNNVFLEVELESAGNFWVRNEMAEIESRFDLQLGGSLRRPEITGRANMVEGGTLVFRDVEYRVETGSLDFVDLQRLDPYLTLRAETEVEDYTVFLRVEGTTDDFEYELTSDPTLVTQDIIALLTTGSTMEELTAAGGGSGAQFTGDLATNYFAGALTDRFEKQLGRLLGFDRVQINPLLVRDEADPTARITVGKKVGRDLFVVFSTDVGNSEDQIYEIEWKATKNFRFTAERDSLGGLGGEVRFSDRFWWTKPDRRGAQQAPEVEATATDDPREETVAAVQLVGVEDSNRAELLKRILLAPGEPFSRSRMFDDVEAIRRHFVKQGRVEAVVDAREERRPDGHQVIFQVSAGPVIELSFEGLKDKERKQIRTELERSWIESVYSEELWEDSRERILEYFRERGYYAVDVQYDRRMVDSVRQLDFFVDRGRLVRVSRVILDGAESIDEDRIRRQMLTRPDTMMSKRLLSTEILQEDLAAIRNLYRDHGFLRVQLEDPSIRLSSAGDSAEVRLRIHEGPRFSIGNIEMPGDLEFPPEHLLEWCGLEQGGLFTPQDLLQGESSLRARLDAQGFPDARVRALVELGEQSADLQFEITLGGRKRVGVVAIQGNRLTKEKIIRRELELEIGDLISREKLLRIQHRLYQLAIFRNVRLTVSPFDSGDEDLYRVEVAVEEAAPFTTSIGAGYDSEAKARVSFSLGNDNLSGRDRVVGIQGRLSGLEQRIQFVAKEPRLFAHKLPALLNLTWEEREEVGFTLERRSVALRIDHEFGPRWKSYGRYNFQKVDLKEIVGIELDLPDEDDLGDIGFAFTRDTRDDPFLTSRGTYLSMGSRVFAEPFLSEFSFVKTVLAGSYVHSFDNRLSLASSVRLGLAHPFADTELVPTSERFFAGGDSTLRGFPRDEVGPNLDGKPLGGEGLFLVNQEFRFPIWASLKGSLFYDAGNVYPKAGDFDPTDLRHVLGAGLRLETPIGPLRLEYGRKLDREDGESSGEFFLAIGAAF